MEENSIQNDEIMRLAEREEPRFLSILLKDKNCLMDSISFGIKPGKGGHFVGGKSRKLFDLMHQYYRKHDAMLTRTAMDSVVQEQDIDEAECSALMMYWDKVHNMHCSTEDYDMLRTHVNNRYAQRQGMDLFQKWAKDLAHAKANQIDVIKEIQEDFNHIDGVYADPYSLTLSFEEAVQKSMEHIEERREFPEKNPGILTGIKGIDDMYMGFPLGDYVVISGMVNGGKTTLMNNIGFNIARTGYNVGYISLEKKAVPVGERLLSLHGMIDYNRIKRGGKGEYGLTDYYYQKYKDAADDLLKNIKPNFYITQMVQGTPLTKILSELDKIRSRIKLHVIIVDYLGVVGLETRTPGRPDLDLAQTSLRLQAYGRKHDALTFTGVQITNMATKEVRKKSQKAEEDASLLSVNTEDLGGSQRVIADADHGISIVLNNDSPPTKAFAHSTKARDSASKITVVLDFDGKIGRISDPVLEPGQIKEVDDLVYGDETIEDVLAGDADLFAVNEEAGSDIGSVDIAVDKIDASVKKVDSEDKSDLADIYQETKEKIEEIPIEGKKVENEFTIDI